MRFHHLTVTAFGPFAGTETVDFDELAEAGVFLLTGPAGAGKTSVLDAVCFALYGVVPGVRETRSLRSHHADDAVRPEVVLEATLGGRRYRIRRSPEWHRPKKRGVGTTRENAAATLVELVDGSERLVTSRVAEVGHELMTLLGMSSDQFMQVVMLPQGQFQTFLHASSDDRQRVLQQLFRTHRFTRVEEWMRDRSRELRERAEEREGLVTRLLATLHHRSGTPLPEPLARSRLGDCAAAALAWAGVVAEEAARHAHDAVSDERAAAAALDEATAAEKVARDELTSHDRRQEAAAQLAALESHAAEAAELARGLRLHHRALQVAPLLEPLEAARRAVDTARSGHSRALRDATRLLTTTVDRAEGESEPLCADRDRGALRKAAATLREHLDADLARLRAVLPHEESVDELRAAVSAAAADLARLRTRFDTTSARAAGLPAERQDVAARLARAESEAAGLDAARARTVEAERRRKAVAAVPAARAAHQRSRDAWGEARDTASTAREVHLALVERRLEGMAAELAGQLVHGQPCVVCGGTEHPHPAPPRVDAVSLEEQRAAAAEHERLQAEADRLREESAAAAAELHALESAAAGATEEEAASQLDEARTALAAAQEAARLLPGLRLGWDQLDEEASTLESELAGLRVAVAESEAVLAAARERCAVAEAALEHALDGRTGPVAALVASLRDARALVDAVVEATDRLTAAESRLTEATEQAERAASTHEFDSVQDVRNALLDPAEADRASHLLKERERLTSAAETVLAELPEPAPGVHERHRTARAVLEERRGAHLAAASRAATSSDRADAVARLAEELAEAVERWEPARAEHATADSLAKLVRGTGTDNQLQMRLSSYVLATRLDQVLDAANERLGDMRDQRYTLRRTGEARGGVRAGLGLEVLDAWTGEPRAPSTLSGGETFVVSLALALGLADVVMHESGGLHVDTLFIDEGFGMLDPDTLDDVMDRIDALRAGGRTVGVVSHVPELRSRIPAQLHVEKGRHGSHLAMRTLVA